MPSPTQRSVDLPLLTFGGRVTQYDPQTLPAGASPYNQDCKFSGVDPSGVGITGGVCSRDGMGTGFYSSPFIGNPTVSYLKTFVDSQSIFHLLSSDSLGNVRDENPCPIPPTDPTVIGQIVANAMVQSDSLLNREWMAISTLTHPGYGIDIPRQWSGQNFDRVSQEGPGAGPSIADYDPAQTFGSIAAIAPVNITSIQSDSVNPSVIDVVLGAPLPVDAVGTALPIVGDTVLIAGTTSYNGDVIITSIQSPTMFQFYMASPPGTVESGTVDFGLYSMVNVSGHPVFPVATFIGSTVSIAGASDGAYDLSNYNLRSFYQNLLPATGFKIYLYNPTLFGEGPATGGTLSPVGAISAGLHGVSVSFITETQYITKPSPPVYWTAGGSKSGLATNIPTGPSNVIGRILMFTPVITPPALTGQFYYFDGVVPLAGNASYPSMVIMDNVTTSFVVNFSDSVLEAATESTGLFSLLELGECAQVTAYSNRLFWCGERNKLTNFQNLSFDGGFSTAGFPLGWTPDPITSGGGGPSPSPYWGGAYRLTGTGSATDQATIYQSAYADYLGVTIIQPKTSYSIRVRAKTSAVVGAVSFQVYVPSSGIPPPPLGAFTLTVGQLTANYQEYIGSLLPFSSTLPTTIRLRVFASTQINTGAYIDIDCVEIFPTLQPYIASQVRGSYALDPESYDQETGFLDIEDNQIAVRATFNLLDGKLYIVKDTGLYSTQDDGSNEPNLWATPIVSATVGTGSVKGVGLGESWAVIAHKTGAYIFWGGEPVKITQEIQPDWDMINWDYDQTIYVTVDTANKRIHIGAPINEAISPNVEFVCDYSQLANAEGNVSGQDIAAHPQAYYSVYNPTRVVAPGKARKWTLWNISMNSCALATMSDGSIHLLRGNGVGNGKVYDQLPTNVTDDGVQIPFQYQTSYMPQVEDEQALQLGSHRKLFKYMSEYICGSGILNWIIYGSQNQRAIALHPDYLQNPAQWDQEKNVNFISERASLFLSTSGAGSWAKITKLAVTVQREVMTPVRGVN